MNKLPVLTIGGSDSSAGAGIQADIKAIAANNGYGLSTLTAITAQSTNSVAACMPVPPEIVAAQITTTFEAFDIAAVKSGMLVDRKRVVAVAEALRRHGAPHYVLDPVMNASSGYPLLEWEALATLLNELAPMAELITPNITELEQMTGNRVKTVQDARQAAQILINRGCRAVLVKGGHLLEAPATDLLVLQDGEKIFPGQPVPTQGASGTGCTYSAAIATHLANGTSLVEAIGKAKHYVTETIRHGPAVGEGVGPMDHFHSMRPAR